MTVSEEALQAAWGTIWDRFYHPGTSLLYDLVSSFDRERRFDHLPTLEEIARGYPNTNGWGTGMEDSAITGGVMLAAVCDRYAATGEEFLRQQAADVFRGLERCGTASSVRGLILRSISPRDGTSHYIETSLDQITHFAHGCWRFYHSPLADEVQRGSMREMITALAELVARRMKGEYDYHLGKENGEPGVFDAMWNVAPHEVGRLPMVYGIAWQLTGERRWRELCRQYAGPAAARAAELRPEGCVVYGLFQHQVSMEVLAALAEDEPALRGAWLSLMGDLADYAEILTGRLAAPQPVELADIDLDWRRWSFDTVYHNGVRYEVPRPPRPFSEFWHPREPGEALLVQLMCPGRPLPAGQRRFLERLIAETDFGGRFNIGMIYPQAAWWRAMRNDMEIKQEQ
jgi:hypothetical protein